MNDTQLLSFSRSIRDPIHGTLYLSDEEIEIIDHALFRRLHRIKQNGLLYYVFPSATHSRFEHSLGVLHVANTAFHSLIRNSHVAGQKDNPAVASRKDADRGDAVAFHDLNNELLTDLLRITRLAALVHNLGHGPFSHTFDAFAPSLRTVIEEVNDLDMNLGGFVEHLKRESQKKDKHGNQERDRVEHEEMSCYFFSKIWKDLFNDDSEGNRSWAGTFFDPEEVPSLVAAVILGETDIARGLDLKDYVPLMNDLVASAPVDADRMDYLERDSRSAGVTYGLYDRQRLMKSFLVYKGSTDSTENEDVLRVGIKRSGLRAVENFVQARFELFVQIYYHKTNRAVQLMLKRLAKKAECLDLGIAQFTDANTSLADLYVELSDERFLRILRGEDAEYKFEVGKDDATANVDSGGETESESPPSKEAECEESLDALYQLAGRIHKRDLWKRVFESTVDRSNAVHKILKECHGKEDIARDSIQPKATKGLKDGARLLQREGAQGIYTSSGPTSDNWLEASAMMRALAEEEEKIARIYFTGTDSITNMELLEEARKISQDLEEDLS